MNEEIRNLEPKSLWNHFADLNAVPRPSKKEGKVIAFMKAFGEDLQLPTTVDEVGNVIIKKPATSGMEDRQAIVLQSHLDMVHQKNNDTDFDFATQGIQMYVDGDWVKAKGTTLGADNGIGVSTIMTILKSDNIPHPAIEALFTIDEETGMTGAAGLKSGVLKGDILLNLDTEEDYEIGIGCAGGIDVTAAGNYAEVEGKGSPYIISVKGLTGGHSGMDIIKGLGNANKIMNRLLYAAQESLQIAEIEGGGLRNAIPRESNAKVMISEEEAFQRSFNKEKEAIANEYKTLEPAIIMTYERAKAPFDKMMNKEAQVKLLQSLSAAHNGVYRMSPEVKGLVETSNNIAKVTIGRGDIKILCLTRSSVDSSKNDLVNALTSAFSLSGYEVVADGDYPGWAPNPDSTIVKVLDKLYKELNGEKANVAAYHAGLECGIFTQAYPDMDMVSIGPNILAPHSPDERTSIKSVQKFWRFVQEILKNIPKR